MNEQTIREQYQRIVSLLKAQRLKEAMEQTASLLIKGLAYFTLQETLEGAKTSYNLMLQYLRQGMNDPARHQLYRQLMRDIWEVADQALVHALDSVSSNYYHTQRRTRRDYPHDGRMLENMLKELEGYTDNLAVCQVLPDEKASLYNLLKRHEELKRELFLNTWCNSCWSREEQAAANAFIASTSVPYRDLSLLVSAVTMSLLACFDSRKMSWLLSACSLKETNASQRAFIGLAICMQQYEERLQFYPELTARLSLLADDKHFVNGLNQVYIQLLRSRETEKIDKKMREEIIPEMIKSAGLMRNMKFGFEEPADEDDRNPDWESAMEQSGLGDKIREMSELQMEGADVYMSTFSQLKGYPFFHEMQNWFYPFDSMQYDVARESGTALSDDKSVLSLILQSGFFCNSDKYSLFFTLTQLPESQRGMIFSQLGAQGMDEMMDEQRSESLRQSAMRADLVGNQYIHDLYRFFKLYQRRHEFPDIFKKELALHRIGLLKNILCKPELLKPVADFHFQKEHPAEALEIYRLLENMGSTNAEVFQKMGYCLQKEKRYGEAIDAYRKADILKPDNVWTIRHMATCYRQTRRYDEALEYYKKVEAIQPENHNILFFIGSCLAEQERYDEALQYFFKLDYLEENCLKAWRAIGWCSFVCGKYEQAQRHYEKVLSAPAPKGGKKTSANSPIAADYLNAGHTAWKLGNLESAVAFYRQALLLCDSREAFIELFEKDRPSLLAQGICEEDIPLVLDMI
jgi:tetratricopeptide (TPR) repeat protein